MKKLMILQAKGKSLGGVWFVNKTLAEALIELDFKVDIISIRNNKGELSVEHDPRINVYTINERDVWEITKRRDILNAAKKFNFYDAFKILTLRIEEKRKINIDYKKLRDIIRKNQPDYIITSHYELLDAIPKEYLSKTINHFHTSFRGLDRKGLKTFKKYKNKIGHYVWLTAATCEEAKKHGILNSSYIYNPIRFTTEKIADVKNNKKLITIGRLTAKEKRINMMVMLIDKLFQNPTFKDWTLELYGSNQLDEESMKIINQNNQIKLMGIINEPMNVLLSSSIYLSTSSYEGFALGILEANECGVPAVAFDFGESCKEEIIDNETGIIIPYNKENEFINKISELMLDPKKLEHLSTNAKKFAQQFNINSIIKEWLNLFTDIDKSGEKR